MLIMLVEARLDSIQLVLVQVQFSLVLLGFFYLKCLVVSSCRYTQVFLKLLRPTYIIVTLRVCESLWTATQKMSCKPTKP
jgi:hypothetical protein